MQLVENREESSNARESITTHVCAAQVGVAKDCERNHRTLVRALRQFRDTMGDCGESQLEESSNARESITT